jgi:hypothetical protein
VVAYNMKTKTPTHATKKANNPWHIPAEAGAYEGLLVSEEAGPSVVGLSAGPAGAGGDELGVASGDSASGVGASTGAGVGAGVGAATKSSLGSSNLFTVKIARGWSSSRVPLIVALLTPVFRITVSPEEDTVSTYLRAEGLAIVRMGPFVVLRVPSGL